MARMSEIYRCAIGGLPMPELDPPATESEIKTYEGMKEETVKARAGGYSNNWMIYDDD